MISFNLILNSDVLMGNGGSEPAGVVGEEVGQHVQEVGLELRAVDGGNISTDRFCKGLLFIDFSFLHEFFYLLCTW